MKKERSLLSLREWQGLIRQTMALIIWKPERLSSAPARNRREFAIGSTRTGGLRRLPRRVVRSESLGSLAEGLVHAVIEDLGPQPKQEARSPLGPLYLLPLHHLLADHRADFRHLCEVGTANIRDRPPDADREQITRDAEEEYSEATGDPSPPADFDFGRNSRRSQRCREIAPNLLGWVFQTDRACAIRLSLPACLRIAVFL